MKKCRMTKLFYDGPDRRVGKVVATLSRSDMTLFIHAVTGHNNLNYMNSIIIPDYTPLCRLCEEEDKTLNTYTRTAQSFGRREWRSKESEEDYKDGLSTRYLGWPSWMTSFKP